jgi:hypothetical protein
MGETIDGQEVLVFDATAEVVSPADGNGRNVLAVLTESTTDEWHRQWDGPGGPTYEQMGVVEIYDLARSTTASAPQTRVVNDDLAVTTVQRPVEAATVDRLVEQYLDGWAESEVETIVYVESLDALFTDAGLDDALETTTAIVEKARAVGAIVRAGFDSDAASARATVRVRDCFETVVGAPIADPAAVADLQRLRADDPTNFGYLRGHWHEALTALDASTRSYPQAKQLYEDADIPETSPRKLGAALSALERLGALALWGDTVGANRYDLTSYDPERAAALGLAAESLTK